MKYRTGFKMRSRLFFSLTALSLGIFIPQSGRAETSTTTYVKSVYSLPLTFDPIQMNDEATLAVGNLIYDGLLKFSPTLSLEPAIAESWSTSSDGKTLTFKLKPEAKFHDQSPVTASDVIESLTRAASKESKVRKYYDCILGMRAIDSHTVEITLKHPFPPFFSVLAGATAKILPKKLIHEKDFFKKPIGSGAFRFTELNVAKSELILDSFAGYYGAIPKIQRMVLKQSTQDDALKLAKEGLVDDLALWPIPAEDPVFRSGKKIRTPVAGTWIIGLNTRQKPFDQPEVRRAFRAAINSEEFRKTIFPDAIPAFGYIPPGLPGYIVTKINDLGKKSKPSKDKIKIVIPEELSEHQVIKDFLEGTFKKQGWNVEVVTAKWDILMKGYSEKKYQSFLVSMNMDYPDAEFLLQNFESTNSDNFSGLHSKKLDSILTEARTLKDRVKREVLYKEALAIVNDSAVTVNLFHPRANYWVSDCVDGFEPNILSEVYIDYSKVSLKNNCHKKALQ